MAARMIVTVVMLLLAIGAFWFDALGAGHVFNPFGILFLLLTAVAWFAWGTLRAGYRAAKDESDLPILRLAAKTIEGIGNTMHPSQPRRSPSSHG